MSHELVDPIGYSLFVRYVKHHFVLILVALSSKTQGPNAMIPHKRYFCDEKLWVNENLKGWKSPWTTRISTWQSSGSRCWWEVLCFLLFCSAFVFLFFCKLCVMVLSVGLLFICVSMWEDGFFGSCKLWKYHPFMVMVSGKELKKINMGHGKEEKKL